VAFFFSLSLLPSNLHCHIGTRVVFFFLFLNLLRHRRLYIYNTARRKLLGYLQVFVLVIQSMSSTKINIFLTGATGYIGGSILTGLLQHPNAGNFNITALIRGDKERVNKLASLNVTPLVGTNDSFEIIEKAAKDSHVVIHTSNSADDLPSTKAIISGLNKQTKETGKPAIYIHTSGTGVLVEDVRGKKGSNTVYSDLNPDQINGLAPEQPHRNVDLFIINSADANPLLKSVIVIPPLIYGIGTGPFNRTSVQLPILVRAALKRHKAEMIGPGEATWNNVHIADLVDAYIIIFNQLVAAYGPDAKPNAQPSPYLTTGREGYYFAENGKHSWRQLSEKIGEVLYKKGIVKSPEVTSFPDDEVESSLWGKYSWFVVGSQSNSNAERVRKLGWKPHRPSLFDSVEEQIDASLNNPEN
jgi:nucleoside-diphosphate-sugar epimerase